MSHRAGAAPPGIRIAASRDAEWTSALPMALKPQFYNTPGSRQKTTHCPRCRPDTRKSIGITPPLARRSARCLRDTAGTGRSGARNTALAPRQKAMVVDCMQGGFQDMRPSRVGWRQASPHQPATQQWRKLRRRTRWRDHRTLAPLRSVSNDLQPRLKTTGMTSSPRNRRPTLA